MKKYSLLIVCLLISSILLAGCNYKSSSNQMVKAQRKLAKYLPDGGGTSKHSGNYINLGDGQKLKYNKNFGPSDPSFDIKIVNPY